MRATCIVLLSSILIEIYIVRGRIKGILIVQSGCVRDYVIIFICRVGSKVICIVGVRTSIAIIECVSIIHVSLHFLYLPFLIRYQIPQILDSIKFLILGVNFIQFVLNVINLLVNFVWLVA